jgi:hypothetical protein
MRHKTTVPHARFLTCVAMAVSLACAGGAFGASPPNVDLQGHTSPQDLRAEQARLMHARCRGCDHDAQVAEKWSVKHFPDSYAGIYFAGTRMLVGYTARQVTRVRSLKRLPSLVVPRRIAPFLYVPEHSLRELKSLQQKIRSEVMSGESYKRLIVGVRVEVRANLVEVSSEHVGKTKRLLRELYGSAAPIRVRYEEPPVPTGSLPNDA